MSNTLLLVTESGSASDPMRRMLDDVLAAWPAGEPGPSADETSFSDLIGEGSSHRDATALIDLTALDQAECYKRIDRLRSLGLAGLVLVADSVDRSTSSGGLLVRSSGCEARELAAGLQALVSRQEAFTEIERELRIVRKTSGGVRDEIQKMSQEMSLAAKIQQELIPNELPEPPGFEAGVLFRPASYVSGDIYNMAAIDEHRIAFFIADAVGHGVPAALLTMIISRSLPMRASPSEQRLITPADALGRLNDELCDVSDGNPRFATAVYGVIDTSTGAVRIANGGHPQPMHIRGDGVHRIDAGGPLLGVFQGATFTEEQFILEPGETLLLYSDGFEVAFPDADAVLSSTSAPAKGYLDHLLRIGKWRQRGVRSVRAALLDLERSLDSAEGSLHQPDDVTAVALSRAA
ncbi:MAG: PP2C family protein-serine/threonine phosphatase [Planctomycetota bacterium]